MPAAAIPAIVMASGTIGASAINYASAKKASTPSGMEAAARRTQASGSTSLLDQGKSLTGFGMPKLQQAGNYFTNLTSGNRAITSQALAPESENINKVYGGAQRTLTRFLRGPDRDYQIGELARQRAGAQGSLFAGARARGVEGLVNLGQYGVSQGNAAYGGAAGIAGDIGNAGMQNRFGGAKLQSDAGASTASLIFELLKSGAFKWGKGGGAGASSGGGAIPWGNGTGN